MRHTLGIRQGCSQCASDTAAVRPLNDRPKPGALPGLDIKAVEAFFFLDAKKNVRGRDASYLAPPAQIRTSPIRAYGSHLGCVTARRDILTKCRMRFSACDTVPRYCARPVLC